jgi:UDP-N-acetylglucosamine 2-epimerase (non-hydrolysing)
MLHIALVLGTRPEAIKLAPLILALRADSRRFRTTVVLSGQHADLVAPILAFFKIHADIDINLMQPNQSLASLTSRAITALHRVLDELKPDWVVVQGDTTTAMACSLAAFYLKIKVAHLEAGLRTNRIHSPFPEEINRRFISQIAALHWAPTVASARALRRESMPLPHARIVVTGNTVIDALLLGVARLRSAPVPDIDRDRIAAFLAADSRHRFVLVTGHRRENFGEPLRDICHTLAALAASDQRALFLYPVHPNPNVRATVGEVLGKVPNIVLTAPKNYPEFVQLLDLSHVIVTDSGGVQEEAPALGKVVLVTRETTERPEGLKTGLVKLVGHRRSRLLAAVRSALKLSRRARRAPKPAFPYGDGSAAGRCLKSLLDRKA